MLTSTISSSTAQALPHAIEPQSKTKDILKSVCHKIISITTSIFKAMAGVALYWATPTLFAIGFLTGIIADDKMAEITKKIGIIWKTQSAWICLTLAIGCYLSLPVTVASGSFLYGAKLGSTITKSSLALAEKQQT